MSKLQEDAGNLIKAKREEKGYTLKQLGEILGVPSSRLYYIEKAKTDTFSLDFLYQLSKALDISVLDIISFKIDIVSNTISSNSNSITLNEDIQSLINLLLDLYNNPNCTSDTMDKILKKILADIRFYNILLSNSSK